MTEVAVFQTEFGFLELGMGPFGVTYLRWMEEGAEETIPDSTKNIVQQIKEYFLGNRRDFSVEFDWSGAGDFDKKVWEELVKIPYGTTVSYSEIAEKLGDPKTVRAVGGANARNPIPIMVPCHRVIGKSGDLTGFAYGLDMKARLLRLENPAKFGKQTSLFE